MNISFANGRLERALNDDRRLSMGYGAQAEKIRRRLDDLAAAMVLEDMKSLPGRCEELSGNRSGQLSLRLNGNYRLVFRPADDPPALNGHGGIDWTSVRAVEIVEVVDYH